MPKYTRHEMAEYMRFRRLPGRIRSTEDKLARLYAEADAIGLGQEQRFKPCDKPESV